jgi:hypothetical protein
MLSAPPWRVESLNLPIAQPQETGHYWSMVTTIIAIYGAVLSTVSTVLGAWYFLRSGPRLQAEAIVVLRSMDKRFEDWGILLRVWNAGRADMTIDLHSFIIHHDIDRWVLFHNGSAFKDRDMQIKTSGPEVPIRISAHSGESWTIGGFDIQSRTSAKLSVMLEVGGKRRVEVPVMDGTLKKKPRFILKPGSSQTN